MKRSFLARPHPVITGIMAGQTPQELIAQSRNAEFAGAQGIAIDLSDLKPEFRNSESLKSVIDSTHLPFMFFLYRNDRWGDSSDDQRQEVLIAAADAGAAMIDVMGDLYDPSPMEITHDQNAIDRQKRLIDRIHAKHSHVVISSHMSCPRTAEQVVEQLRELELRGPDVVKIVTAVNTDDELAEAFRTTMVLRRELKTPFIHLCNGKFSRPHRFLGPALGVSIAFAVHSYEARYGMGQPTISAMKAVLDNMHWNINEI
ncbi:MAG: type I 3-dehydroquinate dehydratase [Phycisphaerae bacterium]|nr:type I 3-dehydroquinate dehydratase [Phycisphaerae bacterium]